MKKILLIADSNMSLSGVPVVFMSIVKNLSKEYLFDIIVLKDNDMFFENEFVLHGGRVFRFNCAKPDNFFQKFIWLFFVYNKKVKAYLKQQLNLKEYSAIHSFQEGFSYPFLKEAKKVGVPKRILHICSAKSAYKQRITFSQIIFNWYQKKGMNYCTNIAFVSQKSLKFNNYKDKGVVIYSIYDENKFNAITECDHNDLVLTQIATFSSRKNQLFSLSVVNELKKLYPNIIFNIVGTVIEKDYLQKMQNYIRDNKLQNNVIFLGNVVDRIALNKKTSYILYPSTMESFGLVLIESQACGIHCFANSDIPNDADMGNTDFIKLDVKSWVDKINSYFKENGNSRKNPINKEKFSNNQFIESIKTLYGD